MKNLIFSIRRHLIVVFISVLILGALGPLACAQTDENSAELKKKAFDLADHQKPMEALPMLEKLVVATPADSQVHLYLAFALVAKAAATSDAAERKAIRVKSRNEFLKAKELGDTTAVLDAMIQGLPTDGADASAYSTNREANDAMNTGEVLFVQGKLDDSFTYYQKALQLDPKIYEAALYSGDVFMQQEKYADAEVWYQKAIAINPDREAGYRYSATPLMKQKKYDEARERYIDAYLAEPYSKFSGAGLMQWAQVTKTKIGHPQVVIPTTVDTTGKDVPQININIKAPNQGINSESMGWMIMYGGTRTEWRKEKFAQTYPKEKTYRHSVQEEADAIRSVLNFVAIGNKPKEMSPSLAKLKQLDDVGLLEAYILLARPDEGIAADYVEFRKANREKLRRYVVEYVLTGGGKP